MTMHDSPSRFSTITVSFGLCCALAPVAAQDPVAEAIRTAAFSPTAAEVFAHVEFLASDELGGRRSGSDEGKRARAYLTEKFEKLGLEPAGPDESFLQPFDRMHMTVNIVDGERRVQANKVGCANVMAWLPGADEKLADEYLLIGAHYDHLGRRGDAIFNGADDNASGTAGLLAIARAMVENEDVRPRRSVLFVAFDAEEQGLRGAEHYVRHPSRSLQQLFAMINLDMIGRGKLLDRKEFALPKRLIGIPDGPAMGVLGPGKAPALGAIARAVFAGEELPLYAPADFGMLGGVIAKQAEGRADHAPFERRRIPFLFFSNSEHDDYHEATDVVDTIDKDALHRVARAVFRTVLAIDALDEKPEFVAPVADKKGDGK